MMPMGRFRRFRRDRSGATAVEFGMIAFPLIMLLVVIAEFSILMFNKASVDSAALELHKQVRLGAANSGNYRSLFCNFGGGLRCDSQTLRLRVAPLNIGSRATTQGNVQESFRPVAGEPFLLEAQYNHSFIITVFNALVPQRVLVSRMAFYGDIE